MRSVVLPFVTLDDIVRLLHYDYLYLLIIKTYSINTPAGNTIPIAENKRSLNHEQEAALKSIRQFLNSGGDTFVLKGYAGTGKTFLMQYLAKWLKENNRKFSMLASTGRAATVLKGKTGFESKTVHGEVYRFKNVEGDDEGITAEDPYDRFGQMTLRFTARPPDKDKIVYIVDESSMLSSEPSANFIATFGSGLLLQDFFEAIGSNKVIFVGDPGQLPPVGQLSSPALDLDWLAANQRTTVSATLEKIERTVAGNDILILASGIRELSSQPAVKWPKLPAANKKNIQLHPSAEELFQEYLKRYRAVGANGTLAIARSNQQVQKINKRFRQELYGDDLPIQTGDILLVNRNNYKVPLTNGDFVEVISIGQQRIYANLNFLSVRVRAITADVEYELLLSLDILYGQTGKFSNEQTRGMMIEFSRKMKKKGIRPNTPSYKEEMKKDDFINCLEATYGYAVTCHKSQGGEWDSVFLFLDSRMYGMPQGELFRWWYTAVTRAKSELHLENGWWIGP